MQERERKKQTIESSERESEKKKKEDDERISTRCTALNPAASSRRANKTKRLFH
jgi:hypothetical protein